MISETRTLGAGIWGAGPQSTWHLKAYSANPHSNIVAIGSRTEASAIAKRDMFGADCPIYTDYEQFLGDENIDLVSVCTPAERHAGEAALAAQAGKHVLIETPVAVNIDELHTLRREVDRAGVKTVVSFVLRWHSMFVNAKALVDSGALGEVFYIQVDHWNTLFQWGVDGPWIYPQSAMLLNGSHAVDMARYLLGADVTSVTAAGFDINPENPATANTVTLVEFANGAIGKVSCIAEGRRPYTFNVEIFGTEGTFMNGRLYTALTPKQNDWIVVPSAPFMSDRVAEPPMGQIHHLVDCVLEDVESHVNLNDAVNTFEVCLAAEMSMRTGNPKIRLPYRG